MRAVLVGYKPMIRAIDRYEDKLMDVLSKSIQEFLSFSFREMQKGMRKGAGAKVSKRTGETYYTKKNHGNILRIRTGRLRESLRSIAQKRVNADTVFKVTRKKNRIVFIAGTNVNKSGFNYAYFQEYFSKSKYGKDYSFFEKNLKDQKLNEIVNRRLEKIKL